MEHDYLIGPLGGFRSVEIAAPDYGGYALGVQGSKSSLPSIYSRSFNMLHEPQPGMYGSVEAREGNGVQYASRSYTAPRQRATSVIGILRTTTLYVDKRYLRVAYQLRDAKGNTQVLTSGLSVRLTIDSPTTSCTGSNPQSGCSNINPYSFNCGGVNSESGIGLCSATTSTGSRL